MPNRSVAVAAFAAALSLSLLSNVPGAAAFECEQQVNQVLQERSVNQSDVDSVKVVRRSKGARPSNNYSLDAWVRLNSCSNGAVVVSMTRYCMVQDVYTTGDCQVGAMPNY